MHSAFYGVWKSGMSVGCLHANVYGTLSAFTASGQLQLYRAPAVPRMPPSFSLRGGAMVDAMRSVYAWQSSCACVVPSEVRLASPIRETKTPCISLDSGLNPFRFT